MDILLNLSFNLHEIIALLRLNFLFGFTCHKINHRNKTSYFNSNFKMCYFFSFTELHSDFLLFKTVAFLSFKIIGRVKLYLNLGLNKFLIRAEPYRISGQDLTLMRVYRNSQQLEWVSLS